MGVPERALAQLDHTHLRAAVVGFRDALRAHQRRLNRLNVYPVPDGDTGTNMALTLESVVVALDGAAGPDCDMVATCQAISHGSLMGARGNSGVILSQVLRGLCHRLDDDERADGATVAEALAEASAAAYGAVMRPVEGTILTVVREAADAAVAAAADPDGQQRPSLVDVLDAAAEAARNALARTPELLPVLAEAGVVDAGGAGFVLLLDALLEVVDGRPVPGAPEDEAEPAIQVGHGASTGTGTGTGVGGDQSGMEGPRYEVMYLLDASDDRIDAFKAAWMEIGESIVVVGGDGLWNCHIHADDIGASIEAGIDVGRPRQIRVTDLAGQVEEERWVRQGLGPSTAARRAVTTAVVAVALGDDVRDGFRSMGAQEVVVGGQTMNPSTADLLEAIDATDAEEVVILPNNKNILPVAAQAAALAKKPVHVVPTRGMVTGLAAMLAYDADTSAEANAKAMEEAAAQVVSGQVTWAVRDSGTINEGDWLGLADDEIVVVDPDLTACATGLLDRLVGDRHELVTVFVGATTPDEATTAVEEWLGAHRPRVSVEVERWRLPLSAYLFSIE